MTPMYGREALKRFREQQAQAEPHQALSLLSQIPPDAEMDDATLTVWNGSRFVAWETWLATAPLVRDESPPKPAQEETRPESPELPGKSSAVQEELW